MDAAILSDNGKRSRKIKILGGWRAFPAHLKFRFFLARCLFQRKRFPCVYLSPKKGGLLKTLQILKDLELKKVVEFDKRYIFSLSLPFFPSEPFEAMTAGGGLNIAAAGTPRKTQVEIAILAITQKCPLSCSHCYERFNIAGEDSVSIETWKRTVRELQDIGVNVITFSGGEPLQRFEALLELLESGDKSLSDFHVHTSGHGVTKAKAASLRRAGLAAAGIGLDDFNPDRHDRIRGYQGAYQEATEALSLFFEENILTYINMCLTKELVRSGGLPAFLEMARQLKVGVVRLLEPKPYGGYFGRSPAELFTDDERRMVRDFFHQANTKKEYRGHPPVSYLAYDESPEQLGCLMGGLGHFYIDGMGHVEPCVFLPVSFGNIREESLTESFKRMRQAIPFPLRRGCPSVLLYEHLERQFRQRGAFPIPFDNLRPEWENLFSPSPRLTL